MIVQLPLLFPECYRVTTSPSPGSPDSTAETAFSVTRWARMAIILGWILILPMLATPWGQYHLDKWLGRTSDEVEDPIEDELPGPRWETDP